MADALPLTPLTLLDAVNSLLRSVGLSEVDTLVNTDANTDSQNAFQALGRTNNQIQALGWDCNTETFTFTPDITGRIQAAPNWLRVRPARDTSTWANRKITLHGGYLYDRKAHTYTFTGPVDLEIIQSLAFEDLPEALRWYITCRAGREFAVGTYPSSGTFKFTEAEEQRARTEALQEDEQLKDATLPESSPHFGKMRRR